MHLSAFIESQCPDCTKFVNNQLVPVWSKFNKSRRLEVKIIPFGNADCESVGDDFRWFSFRSRMIFQLCKTFKNLSFNLKFSIYDALNLTIIYQIRNGRTSKVPSISSYNYEYKTFYFIFIFSVVIVNMENRNVFWMNWWTVQLIYSKIHETIYQLFFAWKESKIEMSALKNVYCAINKYPFTSRFHIFVNEF